jgi:SAM-dependent methyltransferase
MFATVDSAPLSALFRAGERIWNEREDLQQRFPKDRAADFWYWLMWNGPDLDPEIESCLYPQPDPHLIARVVGEETSPRLYFRSGLVNWWMMDGYLREAGFDPVRGGDVLDFGVGCGRILQFFALYSPASRFVGADVDDQAVAWCEDHLDFASAAVLPSEPPCEIPDARFDAIYSYSVFSHLPEDLHRAWLEELARISRPGAAVVVTVQGRHVVEEIVAGRRPGFHPAAKVLERGQGALGERGFAFFPHSRLDFEAPENTAHFDDWDLDRYGSTFILEPYVRREWTDLFELVAYHESPDEWQDYVVLKRRA